MYLILLRMSFTDLRRTRQSKLSKSYIDTTKAPTSTSTEDSAQNFEDDSARAENDTRDAAVTSDDLYKQLPVFAEVRSSIVSGRGVWMKDSVLSGAH
jgi:hypothetical protein